jgi:glycosyltransferase involved in cell wall biosynthesis
MTRFCKVSVIMPCFNHGEFLPEAVASVTSIACDDIELVVVDDGSTDERTRKEIDKAGEAGVKVIRQENRGLAAARNAAIRASKGEYIFPLDADDRLRSGWMETAIGILDSQPQVGIVYGDAQCFGTETHRWVVGPFDRERLLNWNFIHCSALYRRSIWEQNCGYDGGMAVQGLEDWDFWLSALERGWRFEYLPEVFFDYRRTGSSMITRTFAFEDQIREFIAKKHGLLYRNAWLSSVSERQSKENERQSIKWTVRHLSRLLRARLKSRLAQSSRTSSV